jgi:hypothetical protein
MRHSGPQSASLPSPCLVVRVHSSPVVISSKHFSSTQELQSIHLKVSSESLSRSLTHSQHLMEMETLVGQIFLRHQTSSRFPFPLSFPLLPLASEFDSRAMEGFSSIMSCRFGTTHLFFILMIERPPRPQNSNTDLPSQLMCRWGHL